jgi:hypothetical protein
MKTKEISRWLISRLGWDVETSHLPFDFIRNQRIQKLQDFNTNVLKSWKLSPNRPTHGSVIFEGRWDVSHRIPVVERFQESLDKYAQNDRPVGRSYFQDYFQEFNTNVLNSGGWRIERNISRSNPIDILTHLC